MGHIRLLDFQMFFFIFYLQFFIPANCQNNTDFPVEDSDLLETYNSSVPPPIANLTAAKFEKWKIVENSNRRTNITGVLLPIYGIQVDPGQKLTEEEKTLLFRQWGATVVQKATATGRRSMSDLKIDAPCYPGPQLANSTVFNCAQLASANETVYEAQDFFNQLDQANISLTNCSAPVAVEYSRHLRDVSQLKEQLPMAGGDFRSRLDSAYVMGIGMLSALSPGQLEYLNSLISTYSGPVPPAGNLSGSWQHSPPFNGSWNDGNNTVIPPGPGAGNPGPVPLSIPIPPPAGAPWIPMNGSWNGNYSNLANFLNGSYNGTELPPWLNGSWNGNYSNLVNLFNESGSLPKFNGSWNDLFNETGGLPLYNGKWNSTDIGSWNDLLNGTWNGNYSNLPGFLNGSWNSTELGYWPPSALWNDTSLGLVNGSWNDLLNGTGMPALPLNGSFDGNWNRTDLPPLLRPPPPPRRPRGCHWNSTDVDAFLNETGAPADWVAKFLAGENGTDFDDGDEDCGGLRDPRHRKDFNICDRDFWQRNFSQDSKMARKIEKMFGNRVSIIEQFVTYARNLSMTDQNFTENCYDLLNQTNLKEILVGLKSGNLDLPAILDIFGVNGSSGGISGILSNFNSGQGNNSLLSSLSTYFKGASSSSGSTLQNLLSRFGSSLPAMFNSGGSSSLLSTLKSQFTGSGSGSNLLNSLLGGSSSGQSTFSAAKNAILSKIGMPMGSNGYQANVYGKK